MSHRTSRLQYTHYNHPYHSAALTITNTTPLYSVSVLLLTLVLSQSLHFCCLHSTQRLSTVSWRLSRYSTLTSTNFYRWRVNGKRSSVGKTLQDNIPVTPTASSPISLNLCSNRHFLPCISTVYHFPSPFLILLTRAETL